MNPPFRMRLAAALLPALLLTPAATPLHAQNAGGDAASLLRAVQAPYLRIRDYQADLRAVSDIPGVKVPEMQARLYFKQPDRMHIESEGFAMLPRDAVFFSPARFDATQYDAVIQGRDTVSGVPCTRLTLLARSDTLRIQRLTLSVDTRRMVALRMSSNPAEGANAEAVFQYTRVDGTWWLPARIDITMRGAARFRRSGPPAMRGEQKKDSNGAADADRPARITLTYSGYRVNKGISDEVFTRSAPTR